MEPTNKTQKVIGKINALRAIADSTHSKAEKETCLQLAAKLITEFQLSEAELIVQPGTVGEPVDLDSESIIYESGRINLWKSELALELARFNGLFVYNAQIRHSITHRLGTRYRVIGRRSDIELALYCMQYLTQLITELSLDYVPSGLNRKRGVNPARESWCLGCVRGYLAKMQAERDAVMKTASSTALVFIGNKVLEAKEAWQAKTGVTLTKSTYQSKAQHSQDTYSSGYRKGQTLSVNQGIGSGSGTTTPKKLNS